MVTFVCKACHKLVERHEDEAVLCLCLGSTVLETERYCKKCGRLVLKELKNTLLQRVTEKNA